MAKTSFGQICEDAFRHIWVKLWADWEKVRDGGAFGCMIKKVLPSWFPLNIVRDRLKNVSLFFCDNTRELFAGVGANIGDQAWDRILGRAEDEINKAKAEFDKVINDARSKLQSQVDELKGLADRYRDQLNDLESAKNKLLDSVDDLDARVRNLEAQKLGVIKVPTLQELIK